MTTEAKIGIGIVHCQSNGSTDRGYTKPQYISDSRKWSSIIDDTGDVFSHVKIEYDTILRMIHFSKDGEGWYMCSMKPIPGREREYRASWVYFPSSLDLSQKDIKNVIDVAESQIKQIEFDSNKLQEVIQSYSKFIEDSPLYNVPSVQRGFAFRDTSGDFNLFDLYGCMYQKEFTQYEWVLLMDKAQLTFKGNGIEDISNSKIVESRIIKPVSNEFGFIPYHNGVVFQSPVRIMEGESLSVEFKKSGYFPIIKSVRIQADFTITASELKRYFKKKQFVAYDSKTKKPITSALIKPLYATEDTDHSQWIFEEQYLENAEIDVKADGYVADSFIIDLRDKSLNDEIPMYIEPETHEYLFILPLDGSIVKDRDSIEVYIHSQFVIRESPFKGYRCSGTPRDGGVPNRLTVIQYPSVPSSPDKSSDTSSCKNGKKSKHSGYNNPAANDYTPENPYGFSEHREHNPIWKLVKHVGYCLAAIALLAILGYFVYDEFIKDKSSIYDNTTVESFEGGTIDSSDNKWDTAYGYLKEHTNQIRKGDMECFDDLKGLYDIVNGYRFKDYVDYINNHPYRDDILSIDEWKRLYDKAKEIDSNKKGVYNTEDADQSITFENYFKKDFSKLDNTDSNHVNAQERQQSSHNNGQQGGHNNGQQGAHNSGNQQTSNQGDNI